MSHAGLRAAASPPVPAGVPWAADPRAQVWQCSQGVEPGDLGLQVGRQEDMVYVGAGPTAL